MHQHDVDLVLSGATVLTMEEDRPALAGAAIAIRDGRIPAVGAEAEVRAAVTASEVVEVAGGIVMPAWVNTHTHLAMNIVRGAADDLSLEGFLERMLSAEARLLDPAAVRAGVRAGIAELLLGGTTTALDMYWYHEAAQEVAAEAGFRLLAGPTQIGGTDPEGQDFARQLARADEELGRLRAQDPDAPRWVMPHSCYTLSLGELSALAALAARHEARIHVHAAESPGEMEMVRARYGARPIAVLDDAGLLTGRTVLAHAVHLDDAEIALLARRGTAIAHCPVSNLKLGCGFARIPALRGAGVVTGLGTDGAASGGALDMVAAARMAALLHKGTTLDPQAVPAREALRMGTAEGARAVGLADVGLVLPGFRADLQVLDAGGLEAVPSPDPYGVVAYSLGAGAVRHTLSEGRFLVRDRRLTTLDGDRIRADVQELAAQV